VTEAGLDWDAGRSVVLRRVVGDLGDLGENGLAPLVLLHGGPGAAHDYLEPLSAIAETTGRACVFYDQLGCGRSQHLPDAPTEFWTTELFCRELDLLLEHLGIAARYDLLASPGAGCSRWSTRSAGPAGLRSMVIANSPASIALWVTEANVCGRCCLKPSRKRSPSTSGRDDRQRGVPAGDDGLLPNGTCAAIVPFPEALQRTFAQLEADPTVYHTMNGPSEFHVIGRSTTGMSHPSRRNRRARLVISGEHDEATPAVVRPVVEGLQDALGAG